MTEPTPPEQIRELIQAVQAERAAIDVERDKRYRVVRAIGVAVLALVAVVAVQAIFIFGLPFVYGGLLGANGDRIDQIQDERVRNTMDACTRDNAQNATIVGFITDAGPAVPAPILASARRTFPQRDCRAYVAQRVQGER